MALTGPETEDEYGRAKMAIFDSYLKKPMLIADLAPELMRFLASAITGIENMVKTCGQLSKNNNMPEIKQFAAKTELALSPIMPAANNQHR